MRQHRYEKMSLPAYIARKAAGLPVTPDRIGYTESLPGQRTKLVRSAPAGTVSTAPLKVLFAPDYDRSKSEPPPKHRRGFAEKFLPNTIRKA